MDVYIIQLSESPQVLAAQLEQTSSLLNMYVRLLRKTEGTARLIFDEEWQGVSAVSVILISTRAY